MARLLLPLLVMLLAAGPATAGQIRKCKDPVSGKVSYTDKLCPDQSEPQQLDIHDNHVGSLPSGLVQPLTVRSEPPRQPAASTAKPKPPATSTSSARASPMQRPHY
ncbi:MAG: hypothetical protein R3F45_01555 [Gammaproteobacteria bacterium]